MSEYTPPSESTTPLELGDDLTRGRDPRPIYDPRGEIVAQAYDPHAEYIVRACNAHEELVAAVDAAVRYFEVRNLGEPAHELQTKLVSALAKAEGGA